MTSPVEVAQVLRHEGNEVTELREVLPVRASDVVVFNYTREQGLMLITCNRDDFLSLAAKQSDPCLSFSRLRLSRSNCHCTGLWLTSFPVSAGN
jgi:predicted nuclease of predicted toxin-antitoxin system